MNIYIREALKAAEIENSISSRSILSNERELYDLQRRDAQPIQETEAYYDSPLWSRSALQAESELPDLYARDPNDYEQALMSRSPKVAGDFGLYPREPSYDDRFLWNRSPYFYGGGPDPGAEVGG